MRTLAFVSDVTKFVIDLTLEKRSSVFFFFIFGREGRLCFAGAKNILRSTTLVDWLV